MHIISCGIRIYTHPFQSLLGCCGRSPCPTHPPQLVRETSSALLCYIDQTVISSGTIYIAFKQQRKNTANLSCRCCCFGYWPATIAALCKIRQQQQQQQKPQCLVRITQPLNTFVSCMHLCFYMCRRLCITKMQLTGRSVGRPEVTVLEMLCGLVGPRSPIIIILLTSTIDGGWLVLPSSSWSLSALHTIKRNTEKCPSSTAAVAGRQELHQLRCCGH